MRISDSLKTTSLLLGFILFISGCSDAGNDDASEATTSSIQSPEVTLSTNLADASDTTSVVPEEGNEEASPQQIVQSFLSALQLGNDAEISNLLTTKAKQETEKHELVVRSPGSPQATFEVGGVEMVSGGAYVTSLWKEPGADGLTHQFDIIWILRPQTDGWRIAGMATRVAANEPPTYLNFEEPAEMIRIWKDADRRLATQQQEGEATAGN